MRTSRIRFVAPWLIAFASAGAPSVAFAQAAPLAEGIVVGGWTFRPSLEIRVRGEYRRHPVDTGGDVYDSTAVLADGYLSNVPTVIDTTLPVDNQWFVAERSRLGLAVDRGPVTGVFLLQDARVWGSTETAFVGAGEPTLPSLAPYEAYIDVHTRTGRRVFLRLGRQKVVWGEGRLIGASDWSNTARSLDAGRLGFQIADIDVEAMAAILAAPGALPPSVTGTREPVGQGTGAQLYGVDATWRFLPLLNLEAMFLSRIVREPHPTSLTPGDTFVADARVFGDRRGLRYAVEGAYEFGRIATYSADPQQVSRDLGAFGLLAHVSLETALPLHPTFGVRGSYASGGGDQDDVFAKRKRFDPILPDDREGLGRMGLYGWSNLLELGGEIGIKPSEEFSAAVGYHYVALANAQDRWSTADLIPVGAAPQNGAHTLGHELDVTLGLVPWDPFEVQAGYGLFLMGDGGKAVLESAHRGVDVGASHFAYVQAKIHAP